MNKWRIKRYNGIIPFYDENGPVEWLKTKAGEVKEFNDRRDREFQAMSENLAPKTEPSDTEGFSEEILEWQRLRASWNKGSLDEEWKQWKEKFDSEREKFWVKGCVNNPDFAWEFFMTLQHYKLQWMIFYFENLGHLESNEERAREMWFASRLIEIILCKGYDRNSEILPYVNYRNAHRFQYVNSHGEQFRSRKAEVRFRKAYCLYFEWIKTHLMTWID